MTWVLLILAALIAIPLVIEYRRAPMNDAARGSAPGQFAVLPKGVTHYTWQGAQTGPLVVCVHGLTTPSFVWGGLVKGLAALGFRVLTYDLYGRGYSDRPRGAQNAEFFLRQLRDLLDHEGVSEKFTLIGYSMGGAISTSFAARYPERVRALILLAPAGMGIASGKMVNFIRNTPLVGDWLLLARYPSLMRKGIRAERDLPGSVPDIGALQLRELEFRRFVPAVLASLRGILSRPLQHEHTKLREDNVPLLAIWGSDDDVIPISAVGTLAEWNRTATQEEIKGAGHGLTYTHTDQIMQVIREWMAERELTPLPPSTDVQDDAFRP